ncbi:IS1/IS1595 family N-terminal zinc-binding domain-containing protein [Actinomyces marseillensis]
MCGRPMIRHGRTSSGRQRWRCKPCKITTLNEIDSTAKHLDKFLAWLLSRRRQADLLGGAACFVGVVSRCGSYGLSPDHR